MTEKEFKKLKRYQILELMIMQAEQIEQLQNQLKESEEKVTEQEIKIKEHRWLLTKFLNLLKQRPTFI